MPIVWCKKKWCASAKKVDGAEVYYCTEDAISLENEEGCTSYDPTVLCENCKFFDQRGDEYERRSIDCKYAERDSVICDDFELGRPR